MLKQMAIYFYLFKERQNREWEELTFLPPTPLISIPKEKKKMWA